MADPTNKPIQINLNPDVYVLDLQRAVTTHLAEARAALAAIDDGSFTARANTSRSGGVIAMQIPADVAGSIGSREICNPAFLGMARALGKYLDQMVAVRRVLRKAPPLPPGLTTPEEILAAFDRLMEETYLAVARDRKLSYPAKIADFQGITDEARDAALSIFTLRRCLEHHGGIPAEPAHLAYTRFTIFMAGHEMTKTPFTPPTPGTVTVKASHERKIFPAGTPITITEQDLEHVMVTINTRIAGEIRRVA